MLKNKKYGWWALIALVGAWLLYVAWGSSSFQECIAHKENQQTEEQTEKGASKFLRSFIVVARIRTDCFVTFLYDSRDAITAVATAFIAFFTFTLWSSTSGLVEAAKIQSRDMKASIAVSAISNELALKAISADQRPWLEPYGPTITGFKPGKTHLGIDGFYMNISLIAINRGRAPATNVHFNAEIYLSGPNRPQSQERLETFASEWRGQNISPLGAIFRDGQLAMGHIFFSVNPKSTKFWRARLLSSKSSHPT
jgi:hypothetical protein